MQTLKRKFLAAFVLAAAAAASPVVRADVKLPAIISDNMVLQSDHANPIWGWADPNEAVTVTLGDQKKTATAGADGKWMLKLDPAKTGGPVEMTVAGKNNITVKNVLVGDVWICSGQSNMEWKFASSHNASEEAPKANYPKLRHFEVKKATSLTPKADVEGKWVECTPDTVKGFTAVGYFFGRDIHKALNVPVGLIHTSWGGTPAESWTSLEALKAQPALDTYVQKVESITSNLPAAEAKYKADLANLPAAQKQWDETIGVEFKAKQAEWQKAAAAAKAAGKEPPAQPRPTRPRPQNPAPPRRQRRHLHRPL
jgi:sialate O-acetylesterase